MNLAKFLRVARELFSKSSFAVFSKVFGIQRTFFQKGSLRGLWAKTDASHRLAVSLAHSRVHFANAKPQTALFEYNNYYFSFSAKFLKVFRKLFSKSFLNQEIKSITEAFMSSGSITVLKRISFVSTSES